MNWTPEMDQLILQHYTSKGGLAVAAMTGRTAKAVRRRAAKLGVSSDKSATARRRIEDRLRVTVGNSPSITVIRKRQHQPKMIGEAEVTSDTKVTIAAPFVDRRWAVAGKVPSVVDSSQCRAWARAST